MSLEGRQLDHYHLLHLIGSGGMGEIYLAEDTRILRHVAIKVIRGEDHLPGDTPAVQEAERLFQREMKAISSLDHPHILPMFDYGTGQIGETTLTYLAMPYRPEGSLVNWLRKRGNPQLAPSEVAHILLQAADALQHSHEHHIVHQDIKPSNFLIRVRNNATNLPDILLADFGIAKFTNGTATVSQNIRGTPTFMPPEQWEGQPVPASDQYALAITAFQLLTGQVPFRGGMGQLMRQHLRVPPPAPSTINPHLSREVDAVLLRALAKQPTERFPTVLQFAQALRQALLQENEPHATLLAPTQISQHASQSASLVSGEQLHVPIAPADDQQGVAIANNTSQPLPPTFIPASPAVTPVLSELVLSETPPPIASSTEQARPRLTRFPMLLLITIVALVVLGSSGILLARTIVWPMTSGQVVPTPNPTATLAAATTQVQATETAIANDLYLSDKGTLIATDPLSQPEHWDSNIAESWGGSCTFKDGTYHIAQTIGGNRYFHCNSSLPASSNFIYEVQVSIIQGNCGGITFRHSKDVYSGYRFHICRDGSTRLSAYTDGSQYTVLFDGKSSAIHQGLKQNNLVAVMAMNNQLDLYINKQKIASLIDNTCNKGLFALFALDSNEATEVAFSNAKIWQI
jgi:serine/threonine protein kinase